MNRKQRRALKAKGIKVSDQAPRTKEQVRQEFAGLCANLGEMVYRLMAGSGPIVAKIDTLQQEYASLLEAEQPKKEEVNVTPKEA